MWEALTAAFEIIFTSTHQIYLFLGVILGLAIGIFPGLGGIAGLSLVLPFLYGVDPVSGLALMVGLIAVVPTSDTFASVLLGIPGSSASQATVLDGFPLSKQGEAARALSAAFSASLFGGLFGAVLLSLLISVARPLILSFRTPELLMLTALGFSMVGTLAGKSMGKGLVAAGLGVLASTIGEAPANGSPRMTFDLWYLQDSFALVIVGLGIFALPEIVDLLRQDRSISEEPKLGSGWQVGVKDWWHNKWLSFRCAGIGSIVGIIPGLGGSVVDWIAYGHTVQSTKDKSQFGKGDIRGVIGPESSNNAKEGGALLPTILFGIPGSGGMAIFLGGMVLLGLETGPSMLEAELNTTYTIVWSLALANVIGATLCILVSPLIAKLTIIRFPLLAPFILMMIIFAAFQTKQTFWDIVALFGFGLLGIFMRRFHWPRPAFLIGFVLADQAEVYTYQAVQFIGVYGLEYIISPVFLVLLLLTVVSVWIGAQYNRKMHGHGDEKNESSSLQNRRSELIFTGIVILFLALALGDAWLVPILIDKVFPLTIASIAMGFAVYVFLMQMVGGESHPVHGDNEIQQDRELNKRSIARTLGWFVLLIALTAVFGLFIASIFFLLVFFIIRAKTNQLNALLLTLLALGGISIMAWSLNRDFPPGLLQQYFDLPWPFR
ncbi:MAG: tripartite tricarboxylate transporter permease [SAR324 cluster bacterium]|nr:tripartite tricarboxylate transporter permease [SAR324 cluster bacterium]